MDSPLFRKLRRLAAVLAIVLLIKVLIEIVYEYRNYFPADFDSAFLTGRRDHFAGMYAIAFYTHIVSGPIAIVIGTLLALSGGRERYVNLHRWGGGLQLMTITLALTPSGLVMAAFALTGPIAAAGFASLSILTTVCAIATGYLARTKKIVAHQRWAIRCYVLLCSPLLLRLVGGALVLLHCESVWSYRLNAWLSWLLPLAVSELYGWIQQYFRSSERQVDSSMLKGAVVNECY